MILGCCINDPSNFTNITNSFETNTTSQLAQVNSKIPIYPAAQIFVRQPTKFADVHDCDQLAQVAKWSSDHTLIVHSAYVSHPWSGAKHCLFNLAREITLCEKIRAVGLVLHLAPGVRDKTHLTTVFSRIANCSTTIFFETNAVKPSGTSFHTCELLADAMALIQEVAAEYSLHVGLCIDTAHLFANGVSFREYDYTVNWLDTLKELVGDLPIMFHVNDSYEEQGSGRDKHAELTKGNIWKDCEFPNGLNAITEFAIKYHCVMILEQDPEAAMRGMRLLASLPN